MLSLLLLFVSSPAPAAVPELICEPQALVRFERRLWRNSSVELELPEDHKQFAWQGGERAETARALALPEPARLQLPDGAELFRFRSRDQRAELIVERALLARRDGGGIVFVREEGSLRSFYCRSR